MWLCRRGNSLDAVFLVAVPIAVVGVVGALFMRDLPLRDGVGRDGPGM